MQHQPNGLISLKTQDIIRNHWVKEASKGFHLTAVEVLKFIGVAIECYNFILAVDITEPLHTGKYLLAREERYE